MAPWDELKQVLARLRDAEPGALQQFPDPGIDDGRFPPFEIRLAAWAADIAAELHRQFGSDVDLYVGALPYPADRWPRGPRPAGPAPDLLDPREAAVDLDGPAVVRSGHTLRHGLLVSNPTAADLRIVTNGQVTAVVVDPPTGEVIGGFSGAQHLPLVVFTVRPGQTERVPLLIGTASFMPRLGYAVPAGEWGVQATLEIGAGPDEHPARPKTARRRTPALPLTVTA